MNTTTTEFIIRHYQTGEEQRMVELVNGARASESDGLVTVDMIREEWHDSRLDLERDTWVAVNPEGEYIAAAEVWFNDPDDDEEVVTRHIGFAMHPAHRETHRGVMEELLDRALHHATTHPRRQPDHPYVLRAWAPYQDEWKHRLILAHGFEHSHVGYTMLLETLDQLLPVPTVAGVGLEGWGPARDEQLWRALNEAFSTDETYVPLTHAEWRELYHDQQNDPTLWCLAVDKATDTVVGMALCEAEPQTNEVGQRVGWLVDLGVIPAWRGRGLGRALMISAMHALRDRGVTAIKIGIDSNDPTNATQLYEGLGFRVLQGNNTYHRRLDS